jgi:hypothetical protein
MQAFASASVTATVASGSAREVAMRRTGFYLSLITAGGPPWVLHITCPMLGGSKGVERRRYGGVLIAPYETFRALALSNRRSDSTRRLRDKHG